MINETMKDDSKKRMNTRIKQNIKTIEIKQDNKEKKKSI